MHVDRRQPRDERYLSLPPEQWNREWMVSVIQHIDAILEHRLWHAVQDLADQMDYGPFRLSPRQSADFAKVAEAFYRAKAAQDAKCAAGDHHFIPSDSRCRHCREPKFAIVKDD